MYSLVKTSGFRHVLERELVPFAIALLIAQIWFKWGSFALELIGFIAVWIVLGFVADVVLRALKRQGRTRAAGARACARCPAGRPGRVPWSLVGIGSWGADP